MTLIISEYAEKELDKMDSEIRTRFLKHLVRIQQYPPRKHLRFGLPFNVEKVTKQARIIYQIEKDDIFVLHCFDSHKEYEKWFKSYK